MCGSTPTSFDARIVCSSSSSFSTTMMTDLPSLRPSNAMRMKARSFVAVANDEALRVLVHGERGDQFRFAASFETEMKLLAGIDDLFDHFAQLIDLDRENAAILRAVIEFADRGLKRAIDRFDAVPKQILEPNDERKTEAASARFVYDFEDVDLAADFLQRRDDDVSLFVDREISTTPAIDIVSRDGCINVPFVFHFLGRRHGR